MKPRFANQRNRALTLIEVLVIIAVLLVLAALLLPVLAAAKRRSQNINCVNNLKQVNLAFRIWQGDHNNNYPMLVSATNGGMMELNNGQNAWINFAAMSNVLSSPKILHCPADTERVEATNFDDLNGKISYFFNLDASETYPQMLMDGDDNFAIGGIPVKSGLLELSSDTPISWTAARHLRMGNIGFADGSVAELSSLGLQQAFQQTFQSTDHATNRLVIP